MNFHFDASFIVLAVIGVLYFIGQLSFQNTVVLMLVVGLPYGGPPQ